MDLMTATTVFDLERRSASDGRQGAIYIREKPGRSASKGASASAAAKGAKGTSGSAATAKTPAKTSGRST
jgi:hypothetical protein